MMRKLIIPPVFVLFSLISIIAFYCFLPEFNWIPYPANFVGVLVSITGFTMMGKSRDLFTRRQATLAIEKSSTLIQEGIFLRTRNPMYIGMFLLLLGIGICFMNVFSMLIPFVFILIMHFLFVLREEKLMLDAFGKEYIDYKVKVKRWI